MKPHLQSVPATMLGVLLGMTTSFAPLFADDTEVFFGQVNSGTDTRPNVLFVLDTSGSMQSNKDGTEKTRLQHMKEAMYDILDTAQNVNVGIMRFNGETDNDPSLSGGGAVIFPVTSLSQELCANGDCTEGMAISRISTDADDAEEVLLGGIDLNDDNLTMGLDGITAQTVGLRFANLDIPQGATIIDARVEFVAHQSDDVTTALAIGAQLSDDAPAFTDTDLDLTARTLNLNKTPWVPSAWEENQSYETSNIASVVQQVVNRAGWCGGNALVLSIDGTGSRSAKSHDQSAEEAPQLRVTYDTSNIPTSGGCTNRTLVSRVDTSHDDAEMRWDNGDMYLNSSDLELGYDSYLGGVQAMGVRFANLNIPAGSTINSARIEFEVDVYHSGDLTLDIYAESSANASTYSNDRYDLYGGGRSYYATPVSWVNPPAAATNAKVQTPDVSTLVQQVIDGAGWASGNAMAFGILRTSGSKIREFESFDGEPNAAPTLWIDYTTGSGAGGEVVSTARTTMKEIISDMQATGNTPIMDAYYEASLYYLGRPVDAGKTRGPASNRHRYHRVSHRDSFTGGTITEPSGCTSSNLNDSDCKNQQINGEPVYISPLESSCQANHIVFLSDGQPTRNQAITKIKALTGVGTCAINSGNEACGTELANWLQETDHSDSLDGMQNISTYTVGFNLQDEDATLLKALATSGNGKYYKANNALALVNAFRSIIGDVVAEDTSFVSPTATVNQFNRLTHRSDIYFSQFKPSSKPTWTGNLKRYQIGSNEAGEVEIQDINGDPAVDPGSGYFSTSARSFWLDANQPADGKEVGRGGAAAEQILTGIPGVGNRQVYTYTGADDDLPASLTATGNALHEDNDAVSSALLGLQGQSGTTEQQADYRSRLLSWARGVDVLDADGDEDEDEPRYHIGDPLHSQPVILNYKSGDIEHSTVFVATNEGFLHAIDSENGKEQYAFIPRELLKNLDLFYQNEGAEKHPYGLDGPLTFWHDDENGNLFVDDDEKAYLFIGMRRGGRNYYALDVSDRLEPKLAWVIKGGEDGTDGFEELGETWSAAVPARIMIEGTERNVLVIGAGYDRDQDPHSGNVDPSQDADTEGRGVFIVKLETGERLYAALGTTNDDLTLSQLNYSIPSNVRVIDVDSDGLADQFYVGDMGGQVWRFDVTPYHQSGDLLSGGVIADLSGDAAENHRRFYYEPDVALIGEDGTRFLSVSIGSGWRAHPLDAEVEDRFYMIRANDVYTAPQGYGKATSTTTGTGEEAETITSWSAITEDDLINVTDDIDATTNDYGWFLELEGNGEKVLGQSTTFDNTILFASYKPELVGDACSTAIGGGSVYALSVFNGAPTNDLADDGDGDVSNNAELDKEDRQMPLKHGGIPPEVSILMTEHGTVSQAGTEQLPIDFEEKTVRTYWVDLRDQDEAPTAPEPEPEPEE